jgi:hypothetical protein
MFSKDSGLTNFNMSLFKRVSYLVDYKMGRHKYALVSIIIALALTGISAMMYTDETFYNPLNTAENTSTHDIEWTEGNTINHTKLWRQNAEEIWSDDMIITSEMIQNSEGAVPPASLSIKTRIDADQNMAIVKVNNSGGLSQDYLKKVFLSGNKSWERKISFKPLSDGNTTSYDTRSSIQPIFRSTILGGDPYRLILSGNYSIKGRNGKNYVLTAEDPIDTEKYGSLQEYDSNISVTPEGLFLDGKASLVQGGTITTTSNVKYKVERKRVDLSRPEWTSEAANDGEE